MGPCAYMGVKKDTRDVIIVMVAAVAMVGVVFSGLFVYSGTWPPFSVVESGSMQHSDRAELGVIDTGDMVVVRTLDKHGQITTYVEGYHTGYRTFGEYGDVIVYERGGGKNPVIHRPIIWIDYNGDGTWSAPSLANYPYWYILDLTTNEPIDDPDHMKMSGKLVLEKIGFSDKAPYLELNPFTASFKESGYATMGDNPVTNRNFDQNGVEGMKGRLVTKDMVLYTAGFEIPWVGSLKLYFTGKNVDQIPPNSIPNIIVSVVCLITILVVLFAFLDWMDSRRPYDEDEEDPHPFISIGEWLREDSLRCSDDIVQWPGFRRH